MVSHLRNKEKYTYVLIQAGKESEIRTKETAIAASDELTRQRHAHELQARFNGGWLTFNNKTRHWE